MSLVVGPGLSAGSTVERSEDVADGATTFTECQNRPGYRVTVETKPHGRIVTLQTPIGTGYDCLVTDLPYMLLCERCRADELTEEVARLRADLAAERERCADVAHGYFLKSGPPVAPIGTRLALSRAIGAEIAEAIRQGE